MPGYRALCEATGGQTVEGVHALLMTERSW